MPLVFHLYVTRIYSYVIRMSFVCTRILSVWTHMLSVCHSYVLACHPYVTRMCSYVICMYVTRMPSVCHLFVVVCHPYVTHLYSHVIRMSLVCTRMSSVCHSYVLRAVNTTFDMGGHKVCDAGGPTTVGSDAPERILKFWPPGLTKTALSSWKKNDIIFPVKFVRFSAQDILST